MKRWKRFDSRPKSQKFICPDCGEVCTCHTRINDVTLCDYEYCPYCGKKITPDTVKE